MHWRSFTGGVQSYHFRPALRRAYQAGDAVYAVTGTREVEITDGVTTETLSGITTLADLLAAVVAESDLLAVEGLAVDGPVDPSRAATNRQGTEDLAIWTSARVEDAGGTGSVYAQRGPERIAVGDAATELIEAVCTAVTATQGAGLGSERWSVRGSVSGALGLYTSGDQVNGPVGRFRFVIPQRMPEDYDPADSAPIRAQFTIADTASAAAITADPLPHPRGGFPHGFTCRVSDAVAGALYLASGLRGRELSP
ncbi:MAG: hypothetical protein MUC79_16470 [Thiobacillaceae bacterium]|nr:hypothetical protein [Thiobacillaceae bacterium]